MFTRPAGVFIQVIGLLVAILAAAITIPAIFGADPLWLVAAVGLWASVYGLLKLGRKTRA